GKTPPCTTAVVAAGIRRVIVATLDPFAAVNGGGVETLRRAGVDVVVGTGEAAARRLIAPFRMLVEQRRPWVIAKWAMSLDGRVATANRESRWISSEESRESVHALRGRVDGILCGIGTALADDPLLTARPAGPRRAVRIVLDNAARLPLDSRLVRTCREVPVLVATGPAAPTARLRALETAGCEVWHSGETDATRRLGALLEELGGRRLTNLLVEGGPTVLGGFADAGFIDEVWAFIAPMLIGGATAPSSVGGTGVRSLAAAPAVEIEQVAYPGSDVFVRGIVRRGAGVTSPARRG
ncbi:MAG: bifunctional diaminohydroxyphosphoribosylaminopyrimidine deaminase/5-amino-6-(5-phosphoribosylamino)uracil reductase RibD, partial [Planctomycetia bacterium]